MKTCAVLLPTIVLVFSSLLVNAAEPATKPATQTTQAGVLDEPAEKYLALGQEAMHRHKWEDASLAFSKAIELGKPDPALQMLLADSLREQENTALDGLTREIAALKKALEIDPDYPPALRGMIRVCQMIVARTPPTPQNLPGITAYFQKLDKYTARLHQLEPANPAWVDAQNKSLLQQWLMKLEVDKAALADAMGQLIARLKTDASDAEIPALLAQVNLQQAEDIRRAVPGQVQTPDITKLYENAVAAFDTAVATEEAQNARYPELHVKFSRLLEVLVSADQSDAKNAQAYMDRCNREMLKAQNEVKDNEPLYIPIGLEAAALMQRQGKLDDAERILRTLPDTDEVEMQLAGLLEGQPNPSALPQAMDLLEKLLSRRGGEDAQVTPLNFHPLLVLTRVRLRRYEAATDPAEKKRLMDAAIAATDRMNVKYPDDVDVVFLLGEIDMLQGNPVAAIQRLRQATESHPEFQRDWRVMRLLAMAYDSGNQSSAAVEILKRVLHDNPANLDARRTLVSVLVRHDPPQGQTYLDELEKRSPDDPEVIDAHLELLAREQNPDPALVHKYFDRLPERTLAQIDAKLHKANALRLWDEAIRLESGIVKAQPNNTAAALDLARYYLLTSKRDQAARVVADALKANPDNDDLLLFQAQTFKNASPDEILAIRKDIISHMTDPLKRELAWAELYERLGDQEQYEAHLIAAEKIAPDSPIVLAKLFDNALANNRLDEAEKYCQRITELNADSANGLLYRIRLAMARKNYDLALKLASDLVQDLPEFAQAWLTLGQVQQARGEYQQAINDYKSALDRQADNTLAMLGLVQCYDALNRPDEALKVLHNLVKSHPDSDEYRREYIEHLMQFGNPLDAVQALQDEIKRTPQVLELYDRLGGIYVRLARTMKKQNRPDDCQTYLQNAFDVLNQAIKSWPDEGVLYGTLADADIAADKPQEAEAMLKRWADQPDWKKRPEPRQALGHMYQSHVQSLLQAERFQAALDLLGTLDDQCKNQPWYWIEHAHTRKGLDDAAGALADFQHAFTLACDAKDAVQPRQVIETTVASLGNDQAIAIAKPLADEFPWAEIALMNLYYQEKKIGSAVTVARQSLQRLDQFSPDDQIAALKMAGLLFSVAQPKPLAAEAVAAYEKLLVLRPNDSESLNNLADVLADDFTPPRAREGLVYINRAVELAKQQPGGAPPEMLDTQGWLNLLAGNVDQGIAQLQQVIDRKPFPEAYYHLGEGYLLQSHPEEAARQAAKGLELIKQSRFGGQKEVAGKLNDLLSRAKQAMKPAP